MFNKRNFIDSSRFIINDENPIYYKHKTFPVEKLLGTVCSEKDFKKCIKKTVDDGVKTVKNTIDMVDKVQYVVESVFFGKKQITRGDVLAVKRAGGLYYHFAIYKGNGRVIHYAAEKGDYGVEKPFIHEADYDDFKKDSECIYILDFPENPHFKPKYIPAMKSAIGRVPFSLTDFLGFLYRCNDYHLYSSEETVCRAESKVGEDEYSLIFNNCEHFAIWCKTGVSESHQVEKIIKTLLG